MEMVALSENHVVYFTKPSIGLKHAETIRSGGNSNTFYFHPEPWGRWTQFDEHIFQVGWFNHKPSQTSILLST